jgi:Flp pilus assembly protein TadG
MFRLSRIRGPRDRGSMSVEFVIAAPLLVMLILIIALGGSWLDYTSQVGTAARDAARMASDEVYWGNVQGDAQQAAQSDLGKSCTDGLTVTIQDVDSDTWPTTSGDPAQDVGVTVQCTADMSAFGFIDFGIIKKTQTFTATATAPLDPYSTRLSEQP